MAKKSEIVNFRVNEVTEFMMGFDKAFYRNYEDESEKLWTQYKVIHEENMTILRMLLEMYPSVMK